MRAIERPKVRRVKIVGASIAALVLFIGGLATACGGKDDTQSTYTVTQSIPGVGTGGLTGTGYGDTGDTTASEREDAWQIGDPPTLEWPAETECPRSLASDCAGEALVLVATVNLPHGGGITGAFLPERQLALCEWPLTGGRSCELMGESGALAEPGSEAAVYALP